MFEENGADGIEVDERGDGDALVDMLLTQLRANGPFDEGDPDDGFDIDEWNNGDVVASVVSSSANDNHEQGFDFNENDAGDMRVTMLLVSANGNNEEGIEFEEDDDFAGGGDLVAAISRAEASNNGPVDGDAGIKVREKGEGNLDATLSRVETSSNNFDGIQIREDANGSLVASVNRALSTGNDGHGINFDENRTNASDTEGDLTASVSNSTSTGNTGAGRARRSTDSAGRRVTASDRCRPNDGSECSWGDNGKQRNGHRRSLRVRSTQLAAALLRKDRPLSRRAVQGPGISRRRRLQAESSSEVARECRIELLG